MTKSAGVAEIGQGVGLRIRCGVYAPPVGSSPAPRAFSIKILYKAAYKAAVSGKLRFAAIRK